MSVSIELNVHGHSSGYQGWITAEVKATNNGNTNRTGSAQAFGCYLKDEARNFVPGLVRTDPHLLDAQLFPPGGVLRREIHFSVPGVEPGRTYSLTIVYYETKDEATETFSFQPIFMGQEAQKV
jgi:hypothetical protein